MSKKRKKFNSPLKDMNIDEESVVPCWCGRPDHDATVECTLYLAWIHYECLGDFSAVEISHLVNDQPGHYVCKSCVPKLSLNDAEEFRSKSTFGKLFVYREPPQVPVPLPAAGDIPETTMKRLIEAAATAATNAVMSYVIEHLEKENGR